jgi:hypothetical protein
MYLTPNQKALFHEHLTKQVASSVMILTCTQEMPSSDLSQNTDYSHFGFHGFLHSLQANGRIRPQNS